MKDLKQLERVQTIQGLDRWLALRLIWCWARSQVINQKQFIELIGAVQKAPDEYESENPNA